MPLNEFDGMFSSGKTSKTLLAPTWSRKPLPKRQETSTSVSHLPPNTCLRVGSEADSVAATSPKKFRRTMPEKAPCE